MNENRLDADLTLTGAHVAMIRQAAERGYPEEVCGILIGRPLPGGGHEVSRVVLTGNDAETDRSTRYVVPPAALLNEQRSAREDGLEMIGFFHSHPDNPARPSAHDLALAWPVYAYVIVSVDSGVAADFTAWRLAADGSRFEQVATREAEA